MTHNHKDWNDRIAVAEEMVPLIGRLHRNNNVVVSVFGRLLVNVSDIDIIKSHRYARHIISKELPLESSLDILRELVDMNLGTASIDLGQLAYSFEESESTDLRAFLEDALAPVIGAETDINPTDIVLYGFGRIGRLLARILVSREALYDGARLRAIVVRKMVKKTWSSAHPCCVVILSTVDSMAPSPPIMTTTSSGPTAPQSRSSTPMTQPPLITPNTASMTPSW